MSIKHGLLALLDQGPRYGYQLRSEFESRTGSTWPLNVGQVYTTLGRLDRDGLVAPDGEDAEGHVFYRITEPGRAELRAWFDAPVSRTNPPRDELAIKLAMAVTVPGIDIGTVVQAQRAHTLRALQDYTRLKTRAAEDDLAWQLVLESLIFHAEAEVRWLDHCETRLARRAAERAPAPAVERPVPPRERGARR
ncbi:PadR family transcriptional regulator [Embleya sp. MST-111070]|uniref:PadR family transcriptional regulator n=1 Tax=Embleya sp. MST-111070 TaxID=3398231 RepID=UPI003F735317